jgi:hypothetical protein
MDKFLGMTDSAPAKLQLKENEKDNPCNFAAREAGEEPAKEKVTIRVGMGFNERIKSLEQQRAAAAREAGEVWPPPPEKKKGGGKKKK